MQIIEISFQRGVSDAFMKRLGVVHAIEIVHRDSEEEVIKIWIPDSHEDEALFALDDAMETNDVLNYHHVRT